VCVRACVRACVEATQFSSLFNPKNVMILNSEGILSASEVSISFNSTLSDDGNSLASPCCLQCQISVTWSRIIVLKFLEAVYQEWVNIYSAWL
jgi:hypothetical protein